MIFPINGRNYKFITDNSEKCCKDCAFLQTSQNKKYIESAKKNGCSEFLTVEELKDAYGINNIKIIGITGTNGKTTTAAAIYSILLDLGENVALQGTRGFFINEKRIEKKSLTTPPILKILHNLYLVKENGCNYFVMEVSSHAIDQNRIEGLNFALKVFTNITQDHLDYHKTFQEYLNVKSSFFSDDSLKLINKDATKIMFNSKNCYTYALDVPASFNIFAYTMKNGFTAAIKYFDEKESFQTPLHGLFNLYNITAAIASVKLLSGYSLSDICEVSENFAGVSGRMEVVNNNPLIIVDFAHTPDGMEKVLDSVKDRDISVVFGAGGDRDRGKRALMGKVAGKYAKKIYITSDNPRSENPIKIIEEIDKGIDDKSKVTLLENRVDAIQVAIDELQDKEILFVLGKGDEEYQEINGKFIPFDDRVVIRSYLKEKFNL